MKTINQILEPSYRNDKHRECTLVKFTENLVVRFRRIGKYRLAENYKCTINRFLAFNHKDDMLFSDMTSSMIVEFESVMRTEGLTPNTTSYYIRNLRAIYNRAVDEGLTIERNLFKHCYTGVAKTMKRAIPLEELKRLKALNLSEEPEMEFVRDMFFFSFSTRGMSFVDMAYLRKNDLVGNMIVYRRKKTGQLLYIKCEPFIQEILDKYSLPSTPYLLPIIRRNEHNARCQYLSMARYINKRLKILGVRLQLPIPLTMYVARHSWASMAKSRNVPISIISQAMGHDSEKTTRIYLSTLDNSQVDNVNSQILKLL